MEAASCSPGVVAVRIHLMRCHSKSAISPASQSATILTSKVSYHGHCMEGQGPYCIVSDFISYNGRMEVVCTLFDVSNMKDI